MLLANLKAVKLRRLGGSQPGVTRRLGSTNHAVVQLERGCEAEGVILFVNLKVADGHVATRGKKQVGDASFFQIFSENLKSQTNTA